MSGFGQAKTTRENSSKDKTPTFKELKWAKYFE